MPETNDIWVGDGYFITGQESFEDSLRGILNDYYENEMRELSNEEQELARQFIEEGLIVGGRRVGITEGVEKERYHIDPPLLKKLLDSRLIRAENTHLGRSFEISHDTLVAPILKSYEERRAIELEQQRLEEERKRQEELRKARRRLFTAVGLAMLGFALFAVALIFYFQAQSAKTKIAEQKDDIEQSLQALKTAQEETEKARKLQDSLTFVRYFESGKSQMELGNFQLAGSNFEYAISADSLNPKVEEARRLKQQSDERGGKQSEYDNLMTEGEGAMSRQSYITAVKKFKAAANLNLSPRATEAATNRLNAATNELYPLFRAEVNKAKTFYEGEQDTGEFTYTQPAIDKAYQILPYLNRSRVNTEIEELRKIKEKVNN